MLNVFITGTDLNVGKTFITAGLAATMQSLSYSTCVYKPIQSGCFGQNGFMQSPDLVYVKTIDPYIRTYSSYLLREPVIPIIAAENENVIIDRMVIKKDYDTIAQEYDCIITEGTGGLMTPVAPYCFMSDIAKALNIPLIIVIKPDAGTVNQTLLTINHAISKGLKVRGVIINNFPDEVNDFDVKIAPRLIEEYSDAKVLGIVKNFPNIRSVNPNDLITTILNGVDIESVFDVKIAKLEVE